MIRPAELGPSLQKQRLFLVLGEEDCLRDQAIETIRAHGASRSKGASAGDVRSNGDDFSCDVLYGDETNAQEILARAQEVPFFSTHQVVLLKWADKLPTKEGEALVPYFSVPSDSTTMIVSAGKLDGRLKWVQALKKQAVVVNCASLYDNQRLGWGSPGGRTFGDSAGCRSRGVTERTGGRRVVRGPAELEKLSLYVSTKETVNAHDVVAVQGAEPGASVFDLSGAIIHGKVSQALLILEKTLESGEAPLRILGALLWQYRRLWKAKDGLSRRVGEAAVANLGNHAFPAGRVFRHGQTRSLGAFSRGVSSLFGNGPCAERGSRCFPSPDHACIDHGLVPIGKLCVSAPIAT